MIKTLACYPIALLALLLMACEPGDQSAITRAAGHDALTAEGAVEFVTRAEQELEVLAQEADQEPAEEPAPPAGKAGLLDGTAILHERYSCSTPEQNVRGIMNKDRLYKRQGLPSLTDEAEKKLGFVCLVGAGPGDVDLITVRGLRARDS